ncbi:MAG: acyltransferase family protein [Streptococcaceae bacterium]|jgi:hypothetical protein|nr:acyltransferase family protein [Streptococcaceae bacterium]
MQSRKSNFELLRIISIELIILCHFSIYTKWGYTVKSNFSLSQLVITLMYAGGKVGVDLFMLITGYFMLCYKKNIFIKIKNILQIIYFYVFFLAVLIFIKDHSINWRLLLLPFYSNFWFVVSYLLTLIFSPFLIISVKKLERIYFRNLLIILSLLFSLSPLLFNDYYRYLNYTLFFILVFLIGGYIRRFNPFNKLSYRLFINIILILTLFIMFYTTFCIIYGNIYSGHHKSLIWDLRYFIVSNNQLIPLMISICLFEVFRRRNFYSNIINIISSTVFATYLLHATIPVYLFDFWNCFFPSVRILKKSLFYFIPYSFLIIFAVFCCGVIIDLLRQKIMKIMCNFWRSFNVKRKI